MTPQTVQYKELSESGNHDREFGCLRCLLLVMCTYLFAKKKALTLHLARGEGRERYFGCNLMQHKVLASSYQHLMAEAPPLLQRDGYTSPTVNSASTAH